MRGINLNIRHLRAFREVAKHKSVSVASGHVYLSQPAITQAIAKLEAILNAQLFERRSNGMFVTEAGELFLNRVERTLERIENGARKAFKLRGKGNTSGFSTFDKLITVAQLRALLAVAEAGNFSLAARNIGVSQPTLHRTARDLERLSGIPLFKKVSQGIELTRAAQVLAQYSRLAFSELDQGLEEIEALRGVDTGRITVGTMPLARSYILPHAINELTRSRNELDISVIDGPYDDLLHGLRFGYLDLLIGALRDPLPIEDIVQEELFEDVLVVVGRAGHPLSTHTDLTIKDLAAYPWVVPRADTPTRAYFEALFDNETASSPKHVIESSSLVMIRGLLLGSDRLTIISKHQISHETEQNFLEVLSFDTSNTSRPIGVTFRRDWQPTATQSRLLDLLRSASNQVQYSSDILFNN